MRQRSNDGKPLLGNGKRNDGVTVANVAKEGRQGVGKQEKRGKDGREK